MSDDATTEDTLTDRERERLLDRAYRTSSTVGGEMPDAIEMDGETVPLREFYLEVAGRDDLDEDTADRIEAILTYLRRRRMAALAPIRSCSVGYERGSELVRRVHELDRAIDAFESLSEPGYAEEVRREQIASAQELVDLMREIGRL